MASQGMINSLTSLRFFAAFAIVLHHARGLVFTGDFMAGVPLSAGVSFFFVLSGFILSYVYSKKMGTTRLYDFYASRFARIWPAHIFTMLLVVLLFPSFEWTLGADYSWLVALLNSTMLQSIVPVPAYYFSFNGVSWSISTEIFFYLAFPFLLVGSGKGWLIQLAILIAIGAQIAMQLDRYGFNYYSAERLTSFSGHGVAYISPLLRIQEFAIGMFLFRLHDWVKQSRVLNSTVCTILELLSVVLIAFWTQKVVGFGYALAGAGNPAAGEYWGHLATGVLFGVVVLVFSFNRGVVSGLLGLRFFVVLGEISFALYMVHQIVFRFYGSHRGFFSSIPEWLVLPLLILVAIIMAYGIWRFVEMPAQGWLRRALLGRTGRAVKVLPVS